jgi:hypothetical protein
MKLPERRLVEENGVSAVMERGGEERSERTEWGEWKT